MLEYKQQMTIQRTYNSWHPTDLNSKYQIEENVTIIEIFMDFQRGKEDIKLTTRYVANKNYNLQDHKKDPVLDERYWEQLK